MSADAWYYYDPEDGFVQVSTEEEARSRAAEAIDLYRDDARFDGEWPDDVEHVCWGRIVECATEAEDGEDSVDYELRRTSGTGDTLTTLLSVLGDLASNDGGVLYHAYAINLDHGGAPLEVALREWVDAQMPGRPA